MDTFKRYFKQVTDMAFGMEPYDGPPIVDILPVEVQQHVLSFVDARTLLQCRVVCKLWRDILHECHVWKAQLERAGKSVPAKIPDWENPWFLFYTICHKDPFDRNLLKNCSGQLKLKHWYVEKGPKGWAIELPPVGCDPIPSELRGIESCFATTFYDCRKFQIVDLWEEGLQPALLDKLQPKIVIEEWHCARFDCGSRYWMEVELHDEHQTVKEHYGNMWEEEQWQGSAWSKASHVFENYGSGIRYVKFIHAGADTQFWAGHYGSKMTGATVKVIVE